MSQALPEGVWLSLWQEAECKAGQVCLLALTIYTDSNPHSSQCTSTDAPAHQSVRLIEFADDNPVGSSQVEIRLRRKTDNIKLEEECCPLGPHHPGSLPCGDSGILPPPGNNHFPRPKLLTYKTTKVIVLQQLKNLNQDCNGALHSSLDPSSPSNQSQLLLIFPKINKRLQ